MCDGSELRLVLYPAPSHAFLRRHGNLFICLLVCACVMVMCDGMSLSRWVRGVWFVYFFNSFYVRACVCVCVCVFVCMRECMCFLRNNLCVLVRTPTNDTSNSMWTIFRFLCIKLRVTRIFPGIFSFTKNTSQSPYLNILEVSWRSVTNALVKRKKQAKKILLAFFEGEEGAQKL